MPASLEEIADKYRITIEEVQNYKIIFEEIDINNDDKLDANELIEAMKRLGHSMNKRAIKAVIKAADKNGDGCIEFEEYCAIVAARVKHRAKKKDIKSMFKEMDTNKDGFLSPEELQAAWTNMGSPITFEEAEAIVAEADTNGDGLVSYVEFQNLWRGQV